MTNDRRVALVTGGARRVGRAIVLELARAGCDVAIHYQQSHSDAKSLAAEVTQLGRHAVTIPGDLADSAAWPRIIEQVVKEFTGLDILVNNAASFLTDQPDTLGAFDAAAWESMFRLNLIAPMGLCHHAKPHLETSGRGLIVNLCDISSDSPHPNHLAYGCSKAALAALTRGLARAMAPRVRVNGIAPGIAAFPEDYSPRQRRDLIDQVPLKRAGTPEDTARLVRFLFESAGYVTGQVIAVDGGRSLS